MKFKCNTILIPKQPNEHDIKYAIVKVYHKNIKVYTIKICYKYNRGVTELNLDESFVESIFINSTCKDNYLPAWF